MNENSVFVLGHRGMLGHVVARSLQEAGFNVLTTEIRYAALPYDPLVEAVRASGAACVINCLGRIKHKSDDPVELYRTNALFPAHLRSRLHPEQYLVHASTDCVFSGRRGGYRVDDRPDPGDAYGISKMLGEAVARQPGTTVIRTSIVGPERSGHHGLLAWFLSRPENGYVDGYVNHFWNGITTLAWAGLAVRLVQERNGGSPPPSLLQPGTRPVSKHDLLCLFRSAYGTSHRIRPVSAPEAVNRTLVPTAVSPPIAEQLAELVSWTPLEALRAG